MDRTATDELLLLTLTPGLGPTLTARSLAAMGSAHAVVHATQAELAQVQGIGTHRAQAIRSAITQLQNSGAVEREKEAIARSGVTLLTLEDPNYPRLLRLISDPPPVLYVRGKLLPSDDLSLAVVGSRRCSAYGREQADRLSAGAAQAGLCVVSGGALGIDTAAHHAALRAGGRTIAVIGSGLDNPYPSENHALFDRITDSAAGAVLSELPMSAPPRPENFPSRNRIVSGLALGVLVIEAALRSGALITARLAAEDHSREVLALPGRVDAATSAGCHKIIREGWATLVTSVTDVLDALGDAGQLLKAGTEHTPGIPGSPGSRAPSPLAESKASLFAATQTDAQKLVLEALNEPLDVDQLADKTGLPIHVLQAELTLLQVRGSVGKSGAAYFRRRAEG
jgi:DNA processing protein